jgi:hypothetical protein
MNHSAVVRSICIYTAPVGPDAEGVALANTDLNVCTVSLSLSAREAEREYRSENRYLIERINRRDVENCSR